MTPCVSSNVTSGLTRTKPPSGTLPEDLGAYGIP